MSTFAILTIKRFGVAKQRLGDARFRPALAEAMMADVLAALDRCRRIDDILIVSGEPRVHRHRLVIDDPDEGHNPAAMRGIEAAVARGASRVILVAGDCPLIDPAELDALLVDRREHVVVIADRHATGTNGLILSPPRAIEPAFGEGSCARHRRLAEDADIGVSVATRTSLAHDIDTPEDLQALIAAADDSLAPNTRAVLRSEGLL